MTRIWENKNMTQSKGIVLISVLIFLHIITLLGLSFLQIALLQLRQSQNFFQQFETYHAAELILDSIESGSGFRPDPESNLVYTYTVEPFKKDSCSQYFRTTLWLKNNQSKIVLQSVLSIPFDLSMDCRGVVKKRLAVRRLSNYVKI